MKLDSGSPKQLHSLHEGWFQGLRKLDSPNFDARPDGTVVDTIVVHGISLPPAQFGGGYIDALFLNRLNASEHPYFAEIDGLHVSAHFVIERDGRTTQFVSIDSRAWHAGNSFFCGRSRVNDFSIGIELEGTDEAAYEPVQYTALATLVSELMKQRPAISIERLCGHSDVAAGRKTDPGAGFDWPRFRRLVVEGLCDRQITAS